MNISAKILAVFTAAACVTAMAGITVSAESTQISPAVYIDAVPEGFVPVEDPLRDYVPSDEDFLCEVMVTRSIVKQLAVTEPCDQTWRSKYPNNWMWQAHRVVIRSDTILENIIGIQFYSKDQRVWNPTVSGADALWEAANNLSLNGANIMMAFCGDSDSGWFYESGNKYYAMGMGGGRTAVIWDNGYDSNWGVGEHEIGHCYGLDDYCTSNPDVYCCAEGTCVMNGGYKDVLCSRCKATLQKNAHRFY